MNNAVKIWENIVNMSSIISPINGMEGIDKHIIKRLFHLNCAQFNFHVFSSLLKNITMQFVSLQY